MPRKKMRNRYHGRSSSSSIVISLLAVILCCGGLAYLILHTKKKNTQSTGREEKKKGATKSGYLAVRVKGDARERYLTATEHIFPDHPENKTILLHLTPSPLTRWEAEQVRAGRQTDGRFILKTKRNGRMYSIQSGAPGFGVPYGLAFAGDMGKPHGTNVVFQVLKGPKGALFSSVSSTWPDGDFRSLALASDQSVVVWASEGSFESIRFMES